MKLKKLLSKPDIKTLVKGLIDAIDAPIGIESTKNNHLLSNPSYDQLGPSDREELPRHPVEEEGKNLGWVIGGEQPRTLLAFFAYLISREGQQKKLASEVLDKYREINLIYTLSEELEASLEVESVARITLDEASRLIDVDGGALLLYNNQQNTLETLATFGAGYVDGLTVTPGVGIVGSVFTEGQAEIINDVPNDPRFISGPYTIGSMIVAALKSKDEAIGVMVMSKETPVEYRASDLKLFSTLASQAAPAIERAILYETLEEKVRQRTEELHYRALQLETSSVVGQSITSILNLHTLLNEVARLIKERFNYYYVGIFLLDESNTHLTAQAEAGQSGRNLTQAEFQIEDDYEVIIDWVVRHRRPAHIDDLAQDSRINYDGKIRSELALPLIMGDRLLGVIDIQSVRKAAFSPEDIPLLQSLADQVAIAINNATLYESEQAQRQLAETMYHLGRDLSRTLDLSEVLNLTLERLAEIIACEQAVLLTDTDETMEILASRGCHIPPTDLQQALAQHRLTRSIYDSQQPQTYVGSDIDLLGRANGTARGWLGVPLIRLDHVNGVLLVSRTDPTTFSQNEITLAATFAGQAAIALENARLYDRITRFSQELEEMVRQRTEDLMEAYNKLEKLDKSKSDFISIASHELRTPITVLQGYSQMLLADPAIKANTFHSEQIKSIHAGASRLHEIVNSMLDVAKIDVRSLELYPEPLLIPTIIQLVMDRLESALAERELTVTVEDMSHLPPLEADPDALRKAFYHLIINAVKYTPDGGTVTIAGRHVPAAESRLEQEAIEITISDTGIGIDPKFHELIFTKFYQTGELALHSTGKTKFKGAGPGLGLAIVRGTIDAHSGTVWVDSPGYNEENLPGSTFHVQLPLAHQSALELS